MKYLERGGFQTQSLMRLTLGLSIALLSLFWVTNLALFVSRLGFTPASIASYYLGSEADYRPPRTAGAMLEVTHAHLPMMALVILLLTHLLIFAPYAKRTRVLLIVGAFLSAALDEGAGWLVRFVHPGFAIVKLAAFVSLQGILGFLLVGLALFLRGGARAEEANGFKVQGSRFKARKARRHP
ncbi:MAG TPA: hypothetical protein VGQ75_09300 [Thermoanaerobaculia bacterium]|jgi:hypothetical protein|nr:hypothetical protein [Thermoanaerobaculia bacterium]